MKSMKTKLLILLPLFMLGFALNASAQLTQIGPINPANGFPQWIAGPGPGGAPLRLGLCLTDVVCEFDRPIAGNPFSQRIGFGQQAFYWGATADIGQLATLELGVRTAWRPRNVVRNGNQRVVNFLRIDLRNLPQGGTYRVVHPFGVETFNVVADPQGNFNVDFIRAVSGRNFAAALNGPVTRFLRGVRPAAGFIGNQSVPQAITGSPRRTNFFRIVGPPGADLGGAVRPNVVIQRQFLIQGQIVR